ncbi:peptide/nickel transport system substrate-binding protein [Kribbella sp. VKM Ac-2571]|uniref:ABC transporter substrate-binding protein n=1 Tax=Kribbella sp. VKM Ac-2571 TaxID=2512222 RepID=UPI001060272F|nr:ABC transporter substrate-binding protein [Kribbella sp. VKM Ac-2571]TDO52157.1 peptide/nickel transport system substrate-binding protein [Kribbella sp. VKM Ac-2571]
MSEWVRRVSAAVAVGALGVSLAACGEPDDNAPHPGEPTAKLMLLRLATTDAISTLDPAGPSDEGSRTVQANLYQTLLTILPDKPTPVPDAADCQFDSPTTYTCSLKEHLAFPNGHELTSSDVKFSFDRLVRLRTPGGAAALFSSVKSVSTPDELTAVFNLTSPDARLPYLLTTTAASIVDEESYPANKLLDTKAIGSGPYQLAGYKPGTEVTLTKFPGYHGPRAAQNDGVTISLMKDSNALYQAVTTGKADLAFHGFGPGLLDKLRKSDQVQVVETGSAEIRLFTFQMKSLLARNPAVRRAVAQLIDRPAIAKKAYGDHVSPLYSVVPPGYGGQADAFKTEYKQPSRTAAAAILKEANIAVPVPLTVGWTPSQYGVGAKAEVLELKRQLEASGLFRVTLRGAEWPQYQELTKTGAYDLYQAGWTPSYPDADDYLSPFVAIDGEFVNGYRSAAATKLLQQERTEQNGLKRDDLIGQLQGVIAREAPVIPSWQGRLAVVAGKDLENLRTALDPLSFLYLSGLRK